MSPEPRLLGNYRLLRPIGFGGMGEVWAARHVGMGRPAAVKLMTRRLDTAADRDRSDPLESRFEREVKAMSRLTSPHTVQVFDYGTADDGTLYYAMELLDGVDLRTLVIRYGPLEPGRVVALLKQACESLAEAHAQGLIHRDIKPANLFTCRLGVRHDVVKLLDFGLVKLALELDEPDAALTRDLVPMGTVAFMAPEVIEARGHVDHRADIYGLGCVAWWLLTGRRVFEGQNEFQLLAAHLKDEPPAMSSPGVDVPPALEQLVRQCLAKSPGDRPADVTALALALDACAVEPRWTESRAARWWAEHIPPREETTDPMPPQSDAIDLDGTSLEVAREVVLDALRRDFVYSGIGFSEMELRVERARRANRAAELERLIGDLQERPDLRAKAPPAPNAPPTATAVPVPTSPMPAPMPAPGPLPVPAQRPLPDHPHAHRAPGTNRRANLLALFSGEDRAGVWQVPHEVRSTSLFGGTTIDLREARLEPGMTHIRCIAAFGGADIILPPDLYVEVDGIGIFGGFRRPRRARTDPPGPGESWVRISGVALFGGVSVRVKPRSDHKLLSE